MRAKEDKAKGVPHGSIPYGIGFVAGQNTIVAGSRAGIEYGFVTDVKKIAAPRRAGIEYGFVTDVKKIAAPRREHVSVSFGRYSAEELPPGEHVSVPLGRYSAEELRDMFPPRPTKTEEEAQKEEAKNLAMLNRLQVDHFPEGKNLAMLNKRQAEAIKPPTPKPGSHAGSKAGSRAGTATSHAEGEVLPHGATVLDGSTIRASENAVRRSKAAAAIAPGVMSVRKFEATTGGQRKLSLQDLRPQGEPGADENGAEKQEGGETKSRPGTATSKASKVSIAASSGGGEGEGDEELDAVLDAVMPAWDGQHRLEPLALTGQQSIEGFWLDKGHGVAYHVRRVAILPSDLSSAPPAADPANANAGRSLSGVKTEGSAGTAGAKGAKHSPFKGGMGGAGGLFEPVVGMGGEMRPMNPRAALEPERIKHLEEVSEFLYRKVQVGPAPELMMTVRFRFLSHRGFQDWDKDARGQVWEESLGISVGLPRPRSPQEEKELEHQLEKWDDAEEGFDDGELDEHFAAVEEGEGASSIVSGSISGFSSLESGPPRSPRSDNRLLAMPLHTSLKDLRQTVSDEYDVDLASVS
ncbi:hypothetical protein T484DRAFT_1809768 [Baffinella frigidus]|nr:hypothetical protein T484DRAFT_1809768 [Cryptophyta sp. CCMP2293]